MIDASEDYDSRISDGRSGMSASSNKSILTVN